MQKENKFYRSLNKVDSALLLQMADIDNLPYDMIKELHAEICVRREPGWKTIDTLEWRTWIPPTIAIAAVIPHGYIQDCNPLLSWLTHILSHQNLSSIDPGRG